MRITKQSLGLLALPEGRSEMLVFDDGLPGFGIRLRAGGKRTWIAQYRVGTKQRRVTLGTAETLDPDEARRRAREVFAKVHLGGDPQLEKAVAGNKSKETLGSAVARYLAQHAAPRLKPRTLQEVRRALDVAWRPLHELPLDTIKRAQVASRLTEIAKDKGPTTANRARAYLSSFFHWAVEHGLVDDTPVRGTRKPGKETSRDRVLSDEEIALLWACAGAGDYGTIVRLLILTAQRREEVALLLPDRVGEQHGDKPELTAWLMPRFEGLAVRMRNR